MLGQQLLLFLPQIGPLRLCLSRLLHIVSDDLLEPGLGLGPLLIVLAQPGKRDRHLLPALLLQSDLLFLQLNEGSLDRVVAGAVCPGSRLGSKLLQLLLVLLPLPSGLLLLHRLHLGFGSGLLLWLGLLA